MSSVLPWIILHRIIWQEEDSFRSLCHQQQLQSPADEGVGTRSSGDGPQPGVPASRLCLRALRPCPGTVSGLGLGQLMFRGTWMGAEAPHHAVGAWPWPVQCFTSGAGGEHREEWACSGSLVLPAPPVPAQPVGPRGCGPGQLEGSTGQAGTGSTSWPCDHGLVRRPPASVPPSTLGIVAPSQDCWRTYGAVKPSLPRQVSAGTRGAEAAGASQGPVWRWHLSRVSTMVGNVVGGRNYIKTTAK